jgi:long-chain fatty acid transport protein
MTASADETGVPRSCVAISRSRRLTIHPVARLAIAVAPMLVLILGLAQRRGDAAGFLIYDLSGEAIGRGSAVTASTTEPAAVWFNPAALAFMEGTSASAGGVFVSARSRFSPAGGGAETSSERGNFFLPTVYANAAVHDRVAVGMGVYTAFGIGIKWPADWVGRESAISASLETLALNPTVAVKLHPQVSVAVGFDALRGTVDFKNGLPEIVGGDVRLAGGTWGYGGNAAVLYRAFPERLHFALTYRSRVKLSFDGQADFRPASPDLLPALPDQSGTAAITLPDMVTIGVMARPRSDLTLGLDANLVFWSTYDRIDIAFESAPRRAIIPNGRNSFTVRVGADWAGAVEGLHLRAGAILDQSAIPSDSLGPGLPDANRIDATVGVGYSTRRFKADLGYMLVFFLPNDSDGGREGPQGTYRTVAHLLGVTVGATWR